MVDREVSGAQAFTAAVERALAHGESRAVVVIELHAAETGRLAIDDPVAAAAEARISRIIRPDDLLGRLDDGRLAVLTERDGAARVAMRLGDTLREPFSVGSEPLRLAPQIGVGYPEAGITAEVLLRDAASSLRF